MNIDFSTFCLISIPGFLVGLITGRFLSSHGWHSIKKALGPGGRLLSGIGIAAFGIATLMTLGIVVVYLFNFSATANPTNYWVVALVGLGMFIGLLFEIWNLFRR
jgi:hypothetical protein